MHSTYNPAKRIALIFSIIMILDALLPAAALALTSGPANPEFSSFEPVATTNMVNQFTGDFTYNIPVLQIPGANGGGYALSLAYHSGASPEQEASWVGFGWTLNPGAINRNKRGFPDDHKGSMVKYFNEVPKNWTASVGRYGGLEFFSNSANLLGISGHASLRYNNYRGFGYVAGLGLNIGGVVNLGYSVTDNLGSYSYAINPLALLSYLNNQDKVNHTQQKLQMMQEKGEKFDFDLNRPSLGQIGLSVLAGQGSFYGLTSYADPVRPTATTRYSGASFNVKIGAMGAPGPIPVGQELGLMGSYTFQKEEGVYDLNAYGYMYSADALDDSESMMDYYTEKEQPYVKQDKFLGIPFHNPDYYQLTGEGLSGGFRLHHKNAGHFYRNEQSSHMTLVNAGTEITMGTTIGIGADAGIGFQSIRMNREWDGTGNTFLYQFSDAGDEPYFFRFTHDLGGSLSFRSPDDINPRADILTQASIVDKTPFIPASAISRLDPNNNRNGRIGRSSHIAYNTHSAMEENSTGAFGNVFYKSYTKDTDTRGWVSDRSQIGDQIGEFAITNEDGNLYTYGLPVFSREEYNLQYDVSHDDLYEDDEFGFVAYKDISSHERKVGEYRKEKYASAYLLTAITTPDYIDRQLDGPTDDDFGGWTKFTYKRTFGNNESDWYRWRMPYDGLYYAQNAISDPDDDMGSFMSGEKQVYYLDKIETKTHVAIFATSDREDGLPALTDEDAARGDSDPPNQPLQKLDRIDLYAKKDYQDGNNPDAKPIKTVRLAYKGEGEEAWPGIPNVTDELRGKLTLDKVWFEYEGVSNARISPYIFDYTYDTRPQSAFGETYLSLFDELPDPLLETPNYDMAALDAWGNYRPDEVESFNGKSRKENKRTWVNQSENAEPYDPAAWQLKKIRLPSRGEIHIHYEKDTYSYVQNRPAMALASLTSQSGNTRFFLNPDDVGGISDPYEYADRINLLYQNRKIYFKFLYELIGDQDPDLEGCGADYVSGYADFAGAGVSGNQVYIDLDPGTLSDDQPLPIDACRNLVRTQKLGKLNDNCGEPLHTVGDGGDGNKTGEEAAKVVLALMEKAQEAGNMIVSTFAPAELCKAMNYDLSYLRVPMPNDKAGDGLRVKRLLMYSPHPAGPDEAELYGQEFFYRLPNGQSSGVAANEPADAREENPLVDFMARFRQSFGERAVSGKDQKQSEGPLGESILPAPSVGYSRVLTRSIHTGKTDAGFTEHRFFTAKDYPYDKLYAGIGKGFEMTRIQSKQQRVNIPAVIFSINKDNQWLTQGYRFIQTNMHGQIRSIATYAGNHDGDYFDPEKTTLSTEQVFQYFEPGQQIPMVYDLKTNDIRYENPGKEMDLIFESRSIEEDAIDARIEGDLTAVLPLFVPVYVSAMAATGYSESKLRTHVTNKVISYPAIQQSVRTYQDGIYHLEVNMGFSPETGQPLITRTFDGFNELDLQLSADHKGQYHNYTFPASLEYGEMGQQVVNHGKVIGGGNPTIDLEKDGPRFYLTFSGDPAAICNALNDLSSGDLVDISGSGLFHISDEFETNRLRVFPADEYSNDESTAINATLTVIRSGRTNQLNTIAGNITTYGLQPALENFTVSPATRAARQALVDQMNQALATLGSSPANCERITTPVTADMALNHPDESCDDFPDDLVLAIQDGNLTVNIGGYEENPLPGEPFVKKIDSQVVAQAEDARNAMNNLLNELWAAEMQPDRDPDICYRMDPGAPSTDPGCCPSEMSCDRDDNWTCPPDNQTNPAHFPVRLRYDNCTDPGTSHMANYWPNLNNYLSTPVQYLSGNTNAVPLSDYFSIPNRISIDANQDAFSAIQFYDDQNNTPGDILNSVVQINCDNILDGTPEAIGTYHSTYRQQSNPDIEGYTHKIFRDFTNGGNYYNHSYIVKFNQDYSNINCFHDELYPDQTLDYISKLGRFVLDEEGNLKMLFYPKSNNVFCQSFDYHYERVQPTPTGYTVQDTFSLEELEALAPGFFDPQPICGGIQFFKKATLPKCTAIIDEDPDQFGEFDLDDAGNIIYRSYINPCIPKNISCLTGCNKADLFPNVLEANAQSFDDDWSYSFEPELGIPGGSANPYQLGRKGKWRVKGTYTYKAETIGGAADENGERIYKNAGVFKSFELFPWQDPPTANNGSWLPLNTVNHYLPNGEPAEEQDILGVYSTAKFGHQQTVPILVAQNAPYETVLFESFEESGSIQNEAYTGSRSEVINSFDKVRLTTIEVNDQVKEKGLVVSAWIKTANGEDISDQLDILLESPPVDIRFSGNFSRIAQNGHWTLYEGRFTDPQLAAVPVGFFTLWNLSPQPITVDDIRVQPFDAQMNTYVYDANNLRLLASFDDQHFPLLYQYNGEGRLVRKLKATEQGIKTIQETEWHTPKQPRSN